MRALTSLLSSLPLFLFVIAGAVAAPICSNQTTDGGSACQTKWFGNKLTGVLDGDVCRYTVRYGTAARWGYPSKTTNQSGQDAAAFPPMCPQDSPLPSALSTPMAYSEDCLFMTIYTPASARKDSRLPVFVWVHGGSYIQGSISDAGLDGSALAAQTGVVAVFVQYRLGVLGFLPPSVAPSSPDPNLGLRDVVLALQTVKDGIAYAGGDSSRVTLAGESSGASLIRAVWAAPIAQGLYHRLILQSDPMSASDQAALQQMVYADASLGGCTTLACFQALDLSTLLSVQTYVNVVAPYLRNSIPTGESFRPQFGTVTLPHDPTSALFQHPDKLLINTSIPLLLTTTHTEAGALVQYSMPGAVPGPEAVYAGAVAAFLNNATLAGIILGSGLWPFVPGDDGVRVSLETLITDGVWRCSNRAVAGQLAARGFNAYVAEWTRGKIYPFNAGTYCAKSGSVCHGDDIFPSLGTIPDPTATDLAFEASVRAEWSSFIHTGAPTSAWSAWTTASTTGNVYNLGNNGTIRDCSSAPGAFGSAQNPWWWDVYSSAVVEPLGAGVGY